MTNYNIEATGASTIATTGGQTKLVGTTVYLQATDATGGVIYLDGSVGFLLK